jgi:hypothetical protein
MKKNTKKLVGYSLIGAGVLVGLAALKARGVFGGTMIRCADDELRMAQRWMGRNAGGGKSGRIDPVVQEAMHAASGLSSRNAAAFAKVITRCNPPKKWEKYVPTGTGRPVGE